MYPRLGCADCGGCGTATPSPCGGAPITDASAPPAPTAHWLALVLALGAGYLLGKP